MGKFIKSDLPTGVNGSHDKIIIYTRARMIHPLYIMIPFTINHLGYNYNDMSLST